MRYNPALGIFGNLRALFADANNIKNSVFNNKAETDAARIDLEQQATDQYLDMIQAQQDITDIQIQLLEMGV